ncbi:MAG TPA: RNA polymerase sigma factor [Pirellulaceae bacterium]|nr:RNA polymerase sigma factor [Pirellulaceae bacterium]
MTQSEDGRDASDADLARQAQQGEAAAFDELTLRHRPRLVRWLSSLVWDADEAENLAQEALARALAQIANFRPELSFAAWLNGIALNLARHYLRTRSRRAEVTDPAVLQVEAAGTLKRRGVLSSLVSREQQELMRLAIAELPIPLREAFVLHEVEEFDYPDMAAMSGVAEGTLRVRVHRAKALLRDRLGSMVDTWLVQSEKKPSGNR